MKKSSINYLDNSIKSEKNVVVDLLFFFTISVVLVLFLFYINFKIGINFLNILLLFVAIIVFIIQGILLFRSIRFKVLFLEDRMSIRMFRKKILLPYNELVCYGIIRRVMSNGIFSFYSHRYVDVLYFSTIKINSCKLNIKLNKKFYLDYGFISKNTFYIAAHPSLIDKYLIQVQAIMRQNYLTYKDESSEKLARETADLSVSDNQINKNDKE